MSQCIPSVSYIKAAMIGRIRRVRTASGADPSHPAVDICKRMFSYPFQKMEVKYLSRSTFANICKSLWCCSFQPLLLRSGIHLNFFDRKVVSLLFSDGFCPNGLSVKIQRHRIHQRKTQKNGNKAPFIIIL